MENSDSSSKKNGAESDAEDFGKAGISVPETLKKLFTAGLGAAFMTEESVRTFVSEMRLPKETLNVLLQGAAKSKEELMNRVGRELVNVVSKIDVVKEVSRFMEEHKFKITAEVEVTKKKPGGDVG